MGFGAYQSSAAAHSVFDEADSALGFPLSRLCFEGPEEELRQTVNAQPAILATSLACLARAREQGQLPEAPLFVAGHSLGEYTALVVAGALGLADALRLVRERGRLMQEAGDRVASGMAAVLGLSEEALAAVCREATGSDGGVVQVANLNSPGQIVISGTESALARAMELARARGARRVVRLNVSGAFHSPVMEPAATGLARALETLPLNGVQTPVVANVTARPVRQADEIRAELVAQLCAPVRWQHSVEHMVAEGVSTFVEIGPGNVLSGLIKRTCPQVQVINIIA